LSAAQNVREELLVDQDELPAEQDEPRCRKQLQMPAFTARMMTTNVAVVVVEGLVAAMGMRPGMGL